MKFSAIPAVQGTYALVLTNKRTGTIRVGRVSTMALQPGFYLYVGSAFGPGGLSARIKHHRQVAARPHWHIDYLRAACDLIEVWYTTKAAGREHAWARVLAELPGAVVPLPGFGSSDCRCRTHLFWFPQPPSVTKLSQRLGNEVNVHR
jgi:Uri superfamily endonuclease